MRRHHVLGVANGAIRHGARGLDNPPTRSLLQRLGGALETRKAQAALRWNRERRDRRAQEEDAKAAIRAGRRLPPGPSAAGPLAPLPPDSTLGHDSGPARSPQQPDWNPAAIVEGHTALDADPPMPPGVPPPSTGPPPPFADSPASPDPRPLDAHPPVPAADPPPGADARAQAGDPPPPPFASPALPSAGAPREPPGRDAPMVPDRASGPGTSPAPASEHEVLRDIRAFNEGRKRLLGEDLP